MKPFADRNSDDFALIEGAQHDLMRYWSTSRTGTWLVLDRSRRRQNAVNFCVGKKMLDEKESSAKAAAMLGLQRT